jgi:hypothetical protein
MVQKALGIVPGGGSGDVGGMWNGDEPWLLLDEEWREW